jgi:hypothetical protein
MLRSDIPEILFSSIREDDLYRASKLFQIERWCYAHWKILERSGQKGHNLLAQVLSDKEVEAVEFFWNKIKSLPKVELSAKRKEKILMKNTAYTAGPNFRICPDIFEFFLSQVCPNRYPELLNRDLEKNGQYGSLNRIKDMLDFYKFQELFNCLKPSDVTEDDYCLWLKFLIKDCPEHYLDTNVKVFMHMWRKKGFDNHRAFTLDEEMIDDSVFQGKFLVHLVEKGFLEPVWAMLDKANSRQIKEFISSEKANYMHSILEQGDNESLNKFLAYGKSADKGLDQKNKPGPSGDLVEVEVRKTHGKSNVRLGK